MAVPKRKTTPSRRGMRRSHDGLAPINVSFDKEYGEPHLPHRVAKTADGSLIYNGRVIKEKKGKKVADSE